MITSTFWGTERHRNVVVMSCWSTARSWWDTSSARSWPCDSYELCSVTWVLTVAMVASGSRGIHPLQPGMMTLRRGWRLETIITGFAGSVPVLGGGKQEIAKPSCNISHRESQRAALRRRDREAFDFRLQGGYGAWQGTARVSRRS